MDQTDEIGLHFVGSVQPLTVDEQFRDRLRPARWIVHEWTEYWLRADSAVVSTVQVGAVEVRATPPESGHFRIRFENQLGLTTILLRDGGGNVVDRHHLEVIAPKLGTAEASLAFLEAILAALHQQVATAPFVLGSPTGRQVRARHAHHHSLFDLHFFREYGAQLRAAIQAILAQPHRRLASEEWLVLPHQVRQVDRTAMLYVLQTSRPVSGVPRTISPLHRLRPERVVQQVPTETYDTPENRFLKTFAAAMLDAIRDIERQRWWATDVNDDSRQEIGHLREALTMLVSDQRLANLGPMTVMPAQSRVLQRKDGYRDLAALWPHFQRVQEPLFASLQAAMELRQIDQLYELWVLFDLIKQLAAVTRETAALTPKLDAYGSPTNDYAARFGSHGTLYYNRTKRTYSGLSLRPDYLWVPTDGSGSVALDAKFRLRHETIAMVTDEGSDVREPTGEMKATTDDLTKMHAYRDALPNVRAAVVLYPGTRSDFRRTDRTWLAGVTIATILHGETLQGVGAIARTPVSSSIVRDLDGE
jgi:predicted component of viral defense system (DUF524 family)